MTPKERSKALHYALITAFALGLIFVGIGRGIFFLMGIEMADFMVAGGLILIVLSIRHLMTGKMVELQTTSSKETIGIVPIGTPLVVGPAVLTMLLILTERYSIPIVLAAFVLNLLFAWIVFAQANRVARLLREPGLRAASQIASLLLAAIAVMMIREGIAQMLT